MHYTFSQNQAHFFHVVSNIRPLVWICLYICVIPVFALIYWALPDAQFRFPDSEQANFGTWLYYSIVTISTLGFGDITPVHGASQAVTAIEVGCGLIFLGLFLNAVGAMKSEIDVESEIEKQKAIHHDLEWEKLLKSVPMVIHSLNVFLAYCYAVTTPAEKRDTEETKYNPDFKFNDLSGLFQPTGLPFDRTSLPAVERLMQSSMQTSMALDSLQQRIDLGLWPKLLENCFAFVANYQMFSNTDVMFRNPGKIILAKNSSDDPSAQNQLAKKIAEWKPADDLSLDPDIQSVEELFNFIRENAKLAMAIETILSELAMEKNNSFKGIEPTNNYGTPELVNR